MKNVREFSRSYIFLSLLYIAVGIVFLANQSLSVRMIGIGLGVIMLVIGATYGFIFFTGTKKREEGLLQLDLIIGIICVAFGIFILIKPDVMSVILPFVMALVLLVGAIVKIHNTINLRRLMFRRWYIFLVIAIIIIALGVILLCIPFDEEYQMLLYIGICLILDGLTNLTSMICIYASSSKITRLQEQNPGSDIKALIKSEREMAAEKKAGQKAEKKAAKKMKEEIVEDADFVDPEEAKAEESNTSEPMQSIPQDDRPALTEPEEEDVPQSPALYDDDTELPDTDDRSGK